MTAQKKILLRLDDGSLIGPTSVLGPHSGGTAAAAQGTAVKMPIERAVRQLPPRAGEKDIARLKRLIESLQQALPGDALAHYQEELDSKRAKLASPPISAAEYAKCHKILQNVYNYLGAKNKPIFYLAVDRKLYPDYYEIVKKPIFLKEVEERIKYKKYNTPQDFADDMYQVWANCVLYNPEGNGVRLLGEKARSVFEDAWTSSGMYLDSRGKRATAGIAAPKYEPEVFEPPGVPKSGGNRSGSGKKPGGEVNSGPGGRGPLTEADRSRIADQLSALPEEHMDGLMQLLPPEMLEGADGEFELDFNALEEETLWKLDAFLRRIDNNTGTSQQQFYSGASLRLDPDTSGGAEDDEESDED